MKFLHICRWWRVLFPPTPALSLRESTCLAPAFVAQICNLLYRRIAFCGATKMPCAPGWSRGSQNAILRYSRLQICATKAGAKHVQSWNSALRHDNARNSGDLINDLGFKISFGRICRMLRSGKGCGICTAMAENGECVIAFFAGVHLQ